MNVKFFLLPVFFTLLGWKSSSQNNLRFVLIETSYGNIKIKLHDETPLHCNNFIKLVEKRFYDSLLFHRVIPGFVIQGGDPESKHAKTGDKLGEGEAGYTIPAEFNPKFFHKRGAVAAARKGDEENPEQASSGCQFYIVQGKIWNDSLLDLREKRIMNMKAYNRVVKNPANKKLIEEYIRALKSENPEKVASIKGQIDKLTEEELANVAPYKFTAEQRQAYKTIGGAPHLDGSYTIFGEVLEGMDVVDKIASVKTDEAARPLQDIRMKIKILE